MSPAKINGFQCALMKSVGVSSGTLHTPVVGRADHPEPDARRRQRFGQRALNAPVGASDGFGACPLNYRNHWQNYQGFPQALAAFPCPAASPSRIGFLLDDESETNGSLPTIPDRF